MGVSTRLGTDQAWCAVPGQPVAEPVAGRRAGDGVACSAVFRAQSGRVNIGCAWAGDAGAGKVPAALGRLALQARR
jgi:hypothetical protein